MVSFVIPTLNSAATIGECLDSILAQSVPRDEYEIVIADAGSTDATVEIAHSKGVDAICSNPLKTAEAGKAAGIERSKGDFIALVDSDNILPSPGWLAAMMRPFDDPEIFASEPVRYGSRPGDPPLTRYFALLGMNDPICLFAGNYDRMCTITGKWTGMDVPAERKDGYMKISPRGAMPTIGANGFIFRRSMLDKVAWKPYFFDIDAAASAVAAGCGSIAKTDESIIHLYCAKFPAFAAKQRRRICDYLYFSQNKGRTYPWKRRGTLAAALFAASIALFVPIAAQAALFALRAPRGERKLAWWHFPVCYATFLIYARQTIARWFGAKPRMADRSNWQAAAR